MLFAIGPYINIKLSHLVTEALVEKLRIKKEHDYIHQVNEVIKDAKVAEEQHRMAEIIADNTDVVNQMATVSKTRLPEKIGTPCRETLVKVVDGCRQVISLSIFEE